MALFEGLFGKKNETFLGVDIGSSSIKAVQLSMQKGVVTLDTFGEIALGPYGGKEIGQAVKLEQGKIAEALLDLMKEAQIDSRSAGLSIPLKSSLVFNMKMPEVDKKQMDEMVRLEARRYIPVPISEVSLDWSIIPDGHEFEEKDDQGRKFLNILVVAIHKETLSKYKGVSDLAKLDLQFLEIETFSTIRSVVDSDKESVVVLDIGASVTKLYVVEYGVIQKSHIIGVGSQNMLKALETQRRLSNINQELNAGQGDALTKQMTEQKITPVDLDRILNETKKVVLEYQKDHQKNIELAILTGGGSILKGVLPYVQKSLETEIELAHPFEKTRTPAFLENTLRDAGPEFSVAIGLALRGLRM
jgi:type IV pilus assembly protein PilM